MGDGKDRERMDLLTAKFVQTAVMPATPEFHPSGLFALDERGHVWTWEGQHKVWTMYGTNRALPTEANR